MSRTLKFFKYRSLFDKGNITIIPETGKYDSVMIWLAGAADSARSFYPIFHDKKLLGVNL